MVALGSGGNSSGNAYYITILPSLPPPGWYSCTKKVPGVTSREWADQEGGFGTIKGLTLPAPPWISLDLR